MFLENLAVIVGAVIILVLLWIVVGVRHFRYLKRELDAQWELIDESLRKRYDLIPNLIETVRKFTAAEEELVERVIKCRHKVAGKVSKDMDRIVTEHEFTFDINDLINLAPKYPDMARDTNYLELRKEIDDLEKNIEEKTARYNEMVRFYNNHRKAVILAPIAIFGGFGMESIFEAEK